MYHADDDGTPGARIVRDGNVARLRRELRPRHEGLMQAQTTYDLAQLWLEIATYRGHLLNAERRALAAESSA